jgi:hypothetical protein
MMTENIEEKIEELDETMENLNLGEQSEDFMICCGNEEKREKPLDASAAS